MYHQSNNLPPLLNIGFDHLSYFPPEADWTTIGKVIGKSTTIHCFRFDHRNISVGDTTDLFNGVAQNRHLEAIEIKAGPSILCRLFDSLAQYPANCHLSRFLIHCTNTKSSWDANEINSLTRYFSGFNTIEDLCVVGISCDNVWQQLIPAMQHHRVKRLDLTGSKLSYNAITKLRLWFVDPTCTLKSLIFDNTEIAKGGFADLADGLNKNTSVKELSLDNCGDITNNGLRALWRAWKNNKSVLESISLGNNNVRDDVLVDLSSNLIGKRKLKCLMLNGAHITIKGWQALARHLQSPDSVLANLVVGSISDDGAIELANSLAGNTALRELQLDRFDSSPVQNAFLRVLCNKSSIDDTYNSNHALRRVRISGRRRLPLSVLSQLDINRFYNHVDAARKKIIETHFDGDMVVTPFLEMNTEVLSHILAWLGKEKQQTDLSLLCNFLRCMPQVFCFLGNASNAPSICWASSKKRKAPLVAHEMKKVHQLLELMKRRCA